MLARSQWSPLLTFLLCFLFSNSSHWILAIVIIPKECQQSDENPMWGTNWFPYLPIMFTSSFRLLVILDSFRTKETYLKVSKKLQEWLDYVFEVHQCPRKPKVIHIHAQVDKPMSLCVVHLLTFALTGSPSEKFIWLWDICSALCQGFSIRPWVLHRIFPGMGVCYILSNIFSPIHTATWEEKWHPWHLENG